MPSIVTARYRMGVQAVPGLKRDSLLAAGIAVSSAGLILKFGPPGVDLAAHAYQRVLFLQHGFTLWNNFWYGGRYTFVGYSLLYYPLASVLGTSVLAVISAGLATLGFAFLVMGEWGVPARASAWAFALLWPAILLAAAFPFALGMAFVALAAAALRSSRNGWFAVLAALALVTSPLAFLILLVVLIGVALARWPDRRNLAVPSAVVLVAVLLQVLSMRLFPTNDRFPFSLVDLAAPIAFSVLGAVSTWSVKSARPLRGFFVVYGVVCLLAFGIPSALGANVDRMRYAALPIAVLALSLRRWRPRKFAIPVLALAAVWNLTPAVAAISRQTVDTRASYWAPAIQFLDQRLSPSFRVEVVDTADHWAAAYLPDAGIPIVRGWFRQADFPANELLYDQGRLRPQPYLRWLQRVAARYVVLPDAPVDYSSRSEAQLLRSGRSGLTLVARTRHFRIYAVPHPRPIAQGPGAARVLELQQSQLILSLGRPGKYHIAVRWSPYWHASNGCLTRSSDGSIALLATRAGTEVLSFRVDLERSFDVLVGDAPSHCAG